MSQQGTKQFTSVTSGEVVMLIRSSAEFARAGEWTIVTGDFDFADVRNYEPAKFEGIVVLYVPRDRGSAYMHLLLAKFLEYLQTGGAIRGKLLIVEGDRIRVRD